MRLADLLTVAQRPRPVPARRGIVGLFLFCGLPALLLPLHRVAANAAPPPDLIWCWAEPGEAAMIANVAFAAKRHWDYPESWIQRWHQDLTITSVQIATYPVYVAVIADAIVGVSMLSVDGSGFEQEHFWVRPDYIGQGIGRQLFAHSREFIAARCGTHLRIEADPNAVGFYQRMGAVPIGEIAVWPERELPVLRLDINIHE